MSYDNKEFPICLQNRDFTVLLGSQSVIVFSALCKHLAFFLDDLELLLHLVFVAAISHLVLLNEFMENSELKTSTIPNQFEIKMADKRKHRVSTRLHKISDKIGQELCPAHRTYLHIRLHNICISQ